MRRLRSKWCRSLGAHSRAVPIGLRPWLMGPVKDGREWAEEA